MQDGAEQWEELFLTLYQWQSEKEEKLIASFPGWSFKNSLSKK